MIGFAHEIDRTIDVVVSFDDIDMRALIRIVRRREGVQNGAQAVDRRAYARIDALNRADRASTRRTRFAH